MNAESVSPGDPEKLSPPLMMAMAPGCCRSLNLLLLLWQHAADVQTSNPRSQQNEVYLTT
jgi:hypothetical protein